MLTPETEGDFKFQLGVISGKIDLVLAHQAATQAANEARFTRIEREQTDQGEEVAKLKQRHSWFMGGLAAIGGIVSAAGLAIGFHK